MEPPARPALATVGSLLLLAAALLLGSATTARAQDGEITWNAGTTYTFDLTDGDTSTDAVNPCNGGTVTADFGDPSGIGLAPFPNETGGGTRATMGMNGTTTGQVTTLTLNFLGDDDVENLTFTLFDIDRVTNAWDDVLDVDASLNGVATPVTLTCPDPDTVCSYAISGSGTTSAQADANDNNPTFTDIHGQMLVTIPGPLDQVVITYTVDGPGTNNQFVGISGFEFDCATLPVRLASFDSRPVAGELEVRWASVSETLIAGYRIDRRTAEGWKPAGAAPLAAAATSPLAVTEYSARVPSGPGELALTVIDLQGREERFGPFETGETYGRRPRPGSGDDEAVDWAATHRELALAATSPRPLTRELGQAAPDESGSVAVELLVDREGIYSLDLAALGAALGGPTALGAPGAEGWTPRLSRGDVDVPVWVAPGPGGATLSPTSGARLQFVGLPEDTLYTDTAVYRLELLGAPAAATSSGFAGTRSFQAAGEPAGAGGFVEHTTARLAREEQIAYSFAATNGDPWYADRLIAFPGLPVTRDYPFEVTELLAGEGLLELEIWGGTDWPGIAKDHRVVVSINGRELISRFLEGTQTRRLRIPLANGLLVEGANHLSLTLPGDTGAGVDVIHLDGFAVNHPRRLVARDGALSFPGGSAPFRVSGLPAADAVAYAIGDRGSRPLPTRVAPAKDGTWTLEILDGGGEGATIHVATPDRLLQPVIRPAREPEGLLQGAADLLILSHALFLDDLEPLVEARRRQGHQVKVVDVADLYAAYTGGVFDPDALRLYLRDARDRLGSRFVLLVGGDTLDYRDYLGQGAISLMPTAYRPTHPVVRFGPSDASLADVDGNGLADLAIGRFPVRTRSELRTLIEKTLAYDPSSRTALLAAGAEPPYDFGPTSDRMAALLPAGWSATSAQVGRDGFDAARQTLLAGLDVAPALVQFFGHSGPTGWTFDGLLTRGDVDHLANGGRPAVFLQWGCWNAYHPTLGTETLDHRLLVAGPQGAAATLGMAGLAGAKGAERLGSDLLTALARPGTTLGEALLEAQRLRWEKLGPDGLVLGITLLGDPTLVVEP